MRAGGCVILALFLLASSLKADVLGTATFDIPQQPFSVDRGLSGVYNGTEVFPFFIYDPGEAQNKFPTTGKFLFSNEVWTTADIGKTVTETAAANPESAGAIGYLADGVNEFVIAYDGAWTDKGRSEIGGLIGPSESSSFFPGGGGPDFSGMTITDVKETLNSLSTSLGTLPGQQTQVVNVTANYTITVDGFAGVPEPSSLLVFSVVGAIALCRRR